MFSKLVSIVLVAALSQGTAVRVSSTSPDLDALDAMPLTYQTYKKEMVELVLDIDHDKLLPVLEQAYKKTKSVFDSFWIEHLFDLQHKREVEDFKKAENAGHNLMKKSHSMGYSGSTGALLNNRNKIQKRLGLTHWESKGPEFINRWEPVFNAIIHTGASEPDAQGHLRKLIRAVKVAELLAPFPMSSIHGTAKQYLKEEIYKLAGKPLETAEEVTQPAKKENKMLPKKVDQSMQKASKKVGQSNK